MSVAWQQHTTADEMDPAAPDEIRLSRFGAFEGLLFGVLCSLPLWALVAWEFVKGVLR